MDMQTFRANDGTWPNEMQAGMLRFTDEKPVGELTVPALEWPQDLFADEAPSS